MLFVSIWSSFAIALYMLNADERRKTYAAIPAFSPWKAFVLSCTGFVGGTCFSREFFWVCCCILSFRCVSNASMNSDLQGFSPRSQGPEWTSAFSRSSHCCFEWVRRLQRRPQSSWWVRANTSRTAASLLLLERGRSDRRQEIKRPLLAVECRARTHKHETFPGMNSIIGVYFRTVFEGGISEDALDYIKITIPIAVTLAPLGSFLASHFHRKVGARRSQRRVRKWKASGGPNRKENELREHPPPTITCHLSLLNAHFHLDGTWGSGRHCSNRASRLKKTLRAGSCSCPPLFLRSLRSAPPVRRWNNALEPPWVEPTLSLSEVEGLVRLKELQNK